MQKELFQTNSALRKMVGKKVHVTLDGGWIGHVVAVVDESTLSIIRDSGKLESINIFDVRSV